MGSTVSTSCLLPTNRVTVTIRMLVTTIIRIRIIRKPDTMTTSFSTPRRLLHSMTATSFWTLFFPPPPLILTAWQKSCQQLRTHTNTLRHKSSKLLLDSHPQKSHPNNEAIEATATRESSNPQKGHSNLNLVKGEQKISNPEKLKPLTDTINAPLRVNTAN